MNVGTANYNGAVVVIPTRNRAQLAMNAIRSLLDQPVDDFRILVSDNSTSQRDRDDLESFCASVADSRLRYARPPQPLAMPAHWQWAIEQALANYKASHFSYLTDRMMFRDGALKELLELTALYPDKVISYNHDRICDDMRPIRFDQYEVTEKLLEVDSQRLLQLVSEVILHHGLPRMMNCIVPRRVFEVMHRHFGNVFTSIAPDFNFCFRCLDLEDSILFYDKSPLFHYAQDRSNGASALRGESTPDTVDFEANLPVDNSIRNYATPIPALITATNAVFNEYLIYKQETGSPRFADIDLHKYLQANAAEIAEVRNPQMRAEMHALMVKHGFSDDQNIVPDQSSADWRARSSSVVDKLKRARLSSVVAKLKRVTSGRARNRQFEFATLDEAIHYARYISHGNRTSWTFGMEVLHGRELPVPSREQASVTNA
jgi:glycosyltransferase involved in cell wall biosynthesis